MLERIKARVAIRDLFERLSINVKGRKAICPFHNDKKPSMSINDTKGLWYCFVCGFGGDIVGFVMRLESVSFKDALLFINEMFSLGLTEKKAKRNLELEAIVENYAAFKKALNKEIDELTQQSYKIHKITKHEWHAKDYTFDMTYDYKIDALEAKLRELEDARYKHSRSVR